MQIHCSPIYVSARPPTNVYSSHAFPPIRMRLCSPLNMVFPFETGRQASLGCERTGRETRVGARSSQNHSTDGWRCLYIGFEHSYKRITRGTGTPPARCRRASGTDRPTPHFRASIASSGAGTCINGCFRPWGNAVSAAQIRVVDGHAMDKAVSQLHTARICLCHARVDPNVERSRHTVRCTVRGHIEV